MSWISLLLQLLTLRKGISESRSMVDAAREYAVRGKRTVTAFLFAFLAALFFFAGLCVAVIEVGLQIDIGTGVRFSGLMVSASIFVGIGLVNVAVAWGLSRTAATTPAPLRDSENPRAERVKDALEEFLVRFVSQLGKPKDPPHPE
jgi:hypothetical protein